jgi:hypothetical protein
MLLGSILVVPPAPSLAGNEKGGKAADAGGGQGGAGTHGDAIGSKETLSQNPICTQKLERDSNCPGSNSRIYEVCKDSQGNQVGGNRDLGCVK